VRCCFYQLVCMSFRRAADREYVMFRHQRLLPSQAGQGLPQQRLMATNTKAGIDKPLGTIIWVPGVQDCRRSRAGHSGQSPPMTGLLGMVLVGTRSQLPEAILAMLGKQQVPAMGPTHLKAGDQGELPPKHRGLPRHGVEAPLLHGKAQLQPDCPHQQEEEHQHLSAALLQQELLAVILAGARGRQTREHQPEPQHLTEVQQLHQQLASLLGDKGPIPPLVRQGPRQAPHILPLPEAGLIAQSQPPGSATLPLCLSLSALMPLCRHLVASTEAKQAYMMSHQLDTPMQLYPISVHPGMMRLPTGLLATGQLLLPLEGALPGPPQRSHSAQQVGTGRHMYSTQPTLEVLLRLCSYPLLGWAQSLGQAPQVLLGMITPLEAAAVNQAAMLIAPGRLLNLSMFLVSTRPAAQRSGSPLHLVTASCDCICCLHAFIMECLNSGDPLCGDAPSACPFSSLDSQHLPQCLLSMFVPLDHWTWDKRIYVWQVEKQGPALQSASPHLLRESPLKGTAACCPAAALCHLPPRAAPASALPCS